MKCNFNKYFIIALVMLETSHYLFICRRLYFV